MSLSMSIPTVVLGGSGYVAGELLRILSGHPRLRVAAAVSTSQAGEPIVKAFPHLGGTAIEGLAFESLEAAEARFEAGAPMAVFAATPHGATAALLDRVLTAGERVGADVRAVDLSADFRFPDAASYEAIYRKPHGAPHRIGQFHCSIPEHFSGRPPKHATQPGCFTTAVVVAAWPFFALRLAEGPVFASAVTGSSGSGRKLGQGTHHPERNGALYAYSALGHRHEAEMRRFIGLAGGGEPEVEFVPHSGPFVRGIHATLRMTLREPVPAAELVERVNTLYAASPFVRASLELPKLTEVVGTNRCRLGIATRGRTLVVTSAVDNLVKGAAGGAVQWMNRLFELPEDEGLRLPGLGWY
jgi:N-acetyl-gamma-glutamyl-phosphate reductase common form